MKISIQYKRQDQSVLLYEVNAVFESVSVRINGSISFTYCHSAFPKYDNQTIARYSVLRHTIEGNVNGNDWLLCVSKIVDFLKEETIKNFEDAAFIKLNHHLYPIHGCSNPIANRKRKKRVWGKWINGKWVENYRKVYNPLSGGW